MTQIFTSEAYHLAQIAATLMPRDRFLDTDQREAARVAFALLVECEALLKDAERDNFRTAYPIPDPLKS